MKINGDNFHPKMTELFREAIRRRLPRARLYAEPLWQYGPAIYDEETGETIKPHDLLVQVYLAKGGWPDHVFQIRVLVQFREVKGATMEQAGHFVVRRVEEIATEMERAVKPAAI